MKYILQYIILYFRIRFPLKAVKVMHTVALRTESSLPLTSSSPDESAFYKVRIVLTVASAIRINGKYSSKEILMSYSFYLPICCSFLYFSPPSNGILQDFFQPIKMVIFTTLTRP